jgi:hypothetical protein
MEKKIVIKEIAGILSTEVSGFTLFEILGVLRLFECKYRVDSLNSLTQKPSDLKPTQNEPG